MSEELKPCPFCGKPAEIYYEYDEVLLCTYAHVGCVNRACAIMPGTAAFVDEDVAVKVWNRRAEVKDNADAD